MNEPSPEKNQRDFFRVVKFATALGLGGMAAFLYSLKQVHPAIRMELTVGTVAVFLATGVFSWLFCDALARFEGTGAGEPEADRRRLIRRWLAYFITVSTLGTIGTFAYALKDVSSQSRREVVEGTVIAVFVLGAGGLLIRRAFRFFEEQSEAELEQLREEEKDREE